jgi:quercetin dioxygenase-like cupin family protein
MRMSPLERVLHLKADELIYKETIPGASRAVIRGDPDKGAYTAFVRFAPGLRVPLHTHTHETTLVVISGAYLYGTEQGEIRVGAGQCITVPGGLPHWSGGDPREGALFYQHSLEPFDLNVLH